MNKDFIVYSCEMGLLTREVSGKALCFMHHILKLTFPYNPKSHLFLQEQSQLPAAIVLAKHKSRAAQLETQIEQQKQTVKPTNLFSTGIHMVSAAF